MPASVGGEADGLGRVVGCGRTPDGCGTHRWPSNKWLGGHPTCGGRLAGGGSLAQPPATRKARAHMGASPAGCLVMVLFTFCRDGDATVSNRASRRPPMAAAQSKAQLSSAGMQQCCRVRLAIRPRSKLPWWQVLQSGSWHLNDGAGADLHPKKRKRTYGDQRHSPTVRIPPETAGPG